MWITIGGGGGADVSASGDCISTVFTIEVVEVVDDDRTLNLK